MIIKKVHTTHSSPHLDKQDHKKNKNDNHNTKLVILFPLASVPSYFLNTSYNILN